MNFDLESLLCGPLLSRSNGLPLALNAILCDLRPRLIPKCQVATRYRCIARNGQVLLASPLTLEDWVDRRARVRIQLWHKTILPGDRPEPYGLLLSLRPIDGLATKSLFETRLLAEPESGYDLALALGGNSILQFRKRVVGARF